MDADFSHDPKYIPEFIKALGESDVIVGSRYIPGGGSVDWGINRRLTSKGANLLAKVLLGLRVNDITTGYRAYRRQVIEKIDLDGIRSSGYAFQAEMLYLAKKKGFRITEVPIIFPDRHLGTSKLSRRDIFAFFNLCLRIGFRRLLPG